MHLGLTCPNPLSFQFAEGFWLIASGAKRDDLPFSDAKSAGIRSGFLNNTGRWLGFHVFGAMVANSRIARPNRCLPGSLF
jgi:hypothetical protein